MFPRLTFVAVTVSIMSTLVFATATPAWASRWNAAAAGCVVTDIAIAADRYVNTAGGIKFKGTSTGQIVATCSVPENLGTVVGLGMTYQDPDATQTGASVSAQLRRSTKSTGAITTIATINSNNLTGTALQYRFITLSHSMNSNDFWYYIQLHLNRNTSSLDPSIRGVDLRL